MSDIRETLAQLDRKLADLRDQVGDLAREPDVPAPPSPPPTRRPLPEPLVVTAQEPAPAPGEKLPTDAVLDPTMVESLERLGVQIEQLLTVRDRLLSDARRLVRTYERQLDDLEADGPANFSVTVSRGEVRPAYFDGTVTLVVAGASRIQTIQVLEDSLSRIRGAQRAYIRRWHAGALWVELTLSENVELIGELNRVLPFPFAIRSASSQEIALSLEREEAGG